MTHLSDFTFLARAISSLCIILWSIVHMYSIDRFDALRWNVIKRKEVKSMMTVLFLSSIILLLVYDIICTKIKYTEGYIVEPLTNTIISKPSQAWSPENKSLRHVANRILMLVYALENSAIFLLQNLWNYLANKYANSRFISTWQFRINYVFIFITMIGFPCIPIFLKSDDNEKLDYSNVKELADDLRKHTYEEVIPELAAASCNLIVLIYGLMAHFKFSALIKREAGNQILERLKYYRYMNLLLILIVGLSAGSIVTFSIDALSEKQYLNKHKFTSDLIAGIMNFSVTAFWIVLLMIFYPHPCQTYGGYARLQSPAVPSISEPSNRKDEKSSEIKHIEIKVDSTTTTMMDESYDYSSGYSGYYNISDREHNLRNDQVQVPPSLVINSRQIISYVGSPKYHYRPI